MVCLFFPVLVGAFFFFFTKCRATATGKTPKKKGGDVYGGGWFWRAGMMDEVDDHLWGTRGDQLRMCREYLVG